MKSTKHLEALMITKSNLDMQMTCVQLEIMEELRDLATNDNGDIQETVVLFDAVYYKGMDY